MHDPATAQSIVAGAMLQRPSEGAEGDGEKVIVPPIAQAPAPVASAAGAEVKKGTSARPVNNAMERLTTTLHSVRVRVLGAP